MINMLSGEHGTMGIMENDLGKHVIELRRLKGWGQRELGRRAGVSGATISNLEAGTTQPTNDTIVKVARALGEKEEALLRLAGHLPKIPPATDFTTAVCRAFRLLDEAQQNAIATPRPQKGSNVASLKADPTQPALMSALPALRIQDAISDPCRLLALGSRMPFVPDGCHDLLYLFQFHHHSPFPAGGGA